MSEVKIGSTYKHYKGNLYKVLLIAHDSDSLEELVVYEGLYKSEEFGDHPIWVRKLPEFTSKVTVDGVEKERFELQYQAKS